MESEEQRLDGLRRALAAAVELEDETDRLLEVAAIIEAGLEEIGVDAVVVGGLAVAYWSRTQYVTHEIDFVVPVSGRVRRRLVDLGFELTPPRHWVYPGSSVTFEVPGSVLSDGDESEEIETRSGRKVRLISLEDMVLWRTREFLHWKDSRGFQHALYMLESPRLDKARLDARARDVGLADALGWIRWAAEEIKRGKTFETWQIKESAERLARDG